MDENFVAEANARLNSVEAVVTRLGLGRSTVYELLSGGQLRSVKIGSRRLIPESALAEFIENLQASGDPA